MMIMERACTVSINSLGYKEYNQTLLPLLNLDYNGNIMNTHHVSLDKSKIPKKIWSELPAVKQRNVAVHALRIRENFRKLIKDKKAGKSSRSSINDPSKNDGESETKSKLPCKHCGKIGHTMRTHRYCTLSTYKEKSKGGKLC
jgi:hypothetical protein